MKYFVVEDWVRRNNMNFGCILEIRVKESKSESILKKVFIGWFYIINYEYSRGRRIWFVWRDNVCVILVYKLG